ncbi:MAG: LacI family transcriptional regulator [Novosphingobium sp.]|uniref:substrate-binding domain-containing protein n=1 Tax=Novosphingobium sp. TaxID=1874826 RepID=UPI0012CD38AD|nr:substrate-binding domain-containing protein [Novosphingobium sp.]MPS69081.1 LacI family transcriptional regulator [Novosphingobium sp.]
MPPPSRPTMDDVARLAGVSRKTVSRLVNSSATISEHTRGLIEAAMAELGFAHRQPASAGLRPALIVLLHDGSDPALACVMETELLTQLQDGGPALAVHLLAADPAQRLQRFLAAHRPSGAILLPPLSSDPALAQMCAAAGVPCSRPGEPGLACGDRAAMAELVHWLAAEGHRRIGLVAGPETSPGPRLREQGYLDAMADRGGRGPPLVVSGNGTFESGIEAGLLLLDVSPRPSAIVCCNDEMAAGVLHAAARTGTSVPGELSVVGFGDTPLAARTLPPLTSMRVPWAAIAREALTRITDGATARHTFAADLSLRGSVSRYTGEGIGSDPLIPPGRAAHFPGRVPPA